MRSSVLLLLLLWSSLALARNPFQALAEPACQTQPAALEGWRLQGIIGAAPHYVAWLISPQGKSHRLRSQATLPQTLWQVTELTAHTLVLHAGQHCAAGAITWIIKGGFYEKDDDADRAAVPERAAPRQQRSVEPGV